VRSKYLEKMDANSDPLENLTKAKRA